MFSTMFPRFMPKDRIAHVDLRSFLKIDGVDSLSSIFENDWFDHFQDRIDLTILWSQKNYRFGRKTDDRIPNLEYKY